MLVEFVMPPASIKTIKVVVVKAHFVVIVPLRNKTQ